METTDGDDQERAGGAVADEVVEAWAGQAGVSGVGSWPGTDVMDAARTTFGELGEAPHVPYLPELPARGPGSDLIGRGAVMLVDLPVDLQPSGWRLVDHPGRDLQRAQAWLRQDLDVLAEVGEGYQGRLKLQVAGPWTLAASLLLPRLERAIADVGAVRDLTASLAEGVARHVAEVRRLLPGAQIVLQLDEPSLPSVLNGAIPTASGFGRLRAVEAPVAVQALQDVLEAAVREGATGVVHTCAAPPMEVLIAAVGKGGLSLDLARLDLDAWELLGGALDGGASLYAGVIPTGTVLDGRPAAVRATADVLLKPWLRLGIPRSDLGRVVLTPACGLAGSTPSAGRAILERLRQTAMVVSDVGRE